MSDYVVSDTNLTSIANAIRTKGGTSSSLSFPTDFVSAIQAIQTGADCPTFTLYSDGQTGDLASVTCNKTYAQCRELIYTDGNFTGCAKWSDEDRILNCSFFENGPNNELIYNALVYEVPAYRIHYQSNGTITFEANPIPYKYSSDMTTSGATVTAPAGYYYEDSSKSVASGTEGTPTATKGSVSNHSVTVTPSVTNTAGYISGGTHTGTGVTVTASELESGYKEITANGFGIDVTGYSAVDVIVPAGFDCPIFTITRDEDTEEITAITCNKTHYECEEYTHDYNYSVVFNETLDGQQRAGNAYRIYDNRILYYTGEDIAFLQVTYYSDNTITWVEGPIARRSSSDLTASNLTVTAPSGYYASNASKTLTDNNLTASNIKKNVSIFGVTGSYEGSGGTLITKSITANGTFNASSDNADGYSSVIVNVAAPTIALSEQSNTTGTTLIATGSAATAHSIYFEFSDSTNTTITVCYDDALIGTMITSYTPTTYGGKTVTLAQLDGVTWYQPAVIPTGVELVDFTACESNKSINIQGETVATEWYYTSDYTAIEPSMTFSYTASLWHYVAFYDSSHDAIETIYAYTDATVDPNDSNTGHGTLNSTKIPANAKYVRLCGTGADSSHISLIRTA